MLVESVNNKKKKSLEWAKDFIKEADIIINTILDEENDTLENIPENLRNSEKAQDIEDSIEYINEAIDFLDSAINSIDTAIMYRHEQN